MISDVFKNLAVSQYVKFGSYWQGENENEGKSPIEWIVADINGKEVLLISSYCLDCKKFNEEKESAVWKDSTIRRWLNDYFFNEAFNDEEKKIILEKEIINDNENPVEGGSDSTFDKIFLLSLTEIKKYFVSNENRMAAPTKYAIYHNSHSDSNYKTKDGKGTCYWWTRSIGNHFSNTHVAGINYFGYIGASGNLPTANNFSIRPALWINNEY